MDVAVKQVATKRRRDLTTTGIAVLILACAAAALLWPAGQPSPHAVPAHNPAAPVSAAQITAGDQNVSVRNHNGPNPWYTGPNPWQSNVHGLLLADHAGAHLATLTTITNHGDRPIIIEGYARPDDELRLVGIHLKAYHPIGPGLFIPTARPVGYASHLKPVTIPAGTTMWLQLDYQTIGCQSTSIPILLLAPDRHVDLRYQSDGVTQVKRIAGPLMHIVCRG
jgi:hypothetical protein